VSKGQVVLCVLCGLFLSATPLLAQAPADESTLQAGADVPAPKRTKSIAPVYPPEAQAQGLRGIVILELIVDTEGRVASAEVVRSVPPFDEAALAAVRRWEYEVTRVDGKPVRVKMTVPISFTMRLPEVTRAEGIPELRQGAAPAYPAGGQGGGSVTAQVTLDPEGRVAEADVRNGGPPWDEALLKAMRSWRFVVPPGRGVLSFRVQADFIPGAPGEQPRVNLAMSGLQESESFASGSPGSPPPPGPALSPAPATAEPSPAPPAPEPSPAETPEPAAQAPAESVAPTAPATKSATPPPPPVEVLSVPTPPPPPAAPGASSLANVSLGPGVPDLVRGRRPVPPPVARMAGTSGTVEVRFAVDAAGETTVKDGTGPDVLKAAAEDAVRTWTFRRTTAERIHMVAAFNYGSDSASASVTLEP
jgi:TonB family protein